MEVAEITRTKSALILIRIDANWTAEDFKILFTFFDNAAAIISNLYFTNPFKPYKEWMNELLKLSKELNMDPLFFYYPEDYNHIVFSKIEELLIKPEIDINDIEIASKTQRNIMRLYFLFAAIKDVLFDKRRKDVQVLSINYNSPGEIITETASEIAKPLSDVLNAFLFYSKKRKQLELQNKQEELKLNKQQLEYNRQIRQDEIENLKDDLVNQISIIKLFNELKTELVKFGRTEKEAELFIHQYLINNLNVIFPTFDKIENVNVLIE